MPTKKILGLDLGTNSIGFALIEHDFEKKEGQIITLGSRIIPMSQSEISDFGKGVIQSQTATRTRIRSARKMLQRNKLRRERLHRVLNILGFLPEHYQKAIDFEQRKGQFKKETEVKVSYLFEEGQYRFLFQESFNEMVKDFQAIHGENYRLSSDWTIYYLRKKALHTKISKQELAWLLLHFNKKRGYQAFRDEIEDTSLKEEIFISSEVIRVEQKEKSKKKDGGYWYDIHLDTGDLYRRESKQSLQNWAGTTKDFIVTIQLDKDGKGKTDKQGNVQKSFRNVDPDKDWLAIKKKTEQDIKTSQKFVGEYIYDHLLQQPSDKVRGKLVHTIDRSCYRDELIAILNEQQKYHSELTDVALYQACIQELYPKNEVHKAQLKDKGFTYLFVDDILFYQRPLKSQKSQISNCPYEKRSFWREVDGAKEQTVEFLKVIPKSHPLFEEFRLWQFLSNLKIYRRNIVSDTDITTEVIGEEHDWAGLYSFLIWQKEISQKALLKKLLPKEKNPEQNYRWNYVEDRKYPMGETHHLLASRLSKVEGAVHIYNFLDQADKKQKTQKLKQRLWHLLYSVKDQKAYESGLKKFALTFSLDEESFVENFRKVPSFKSEYGAYSEKAIKKLLPLMRKGLHWNEKHISTETTERILAIQERLESIHYDAEKVGNVSDDEFSSACLKSFIETKEQNPLKGLKVHQALYAIYGKHSELKDLKYWKEPSDIDDYLNSFKQHSLRNPIVERVVLESLRVVRDLWINYGESKTNFFDAIHIELGRELKNPADKRKAITDRNLENENTNHRIRLLLQEFNEDPSIEGDINMNSPSQQELLKLYEDGILNNDRELSDDIVKIRKNIAPTREEIKRYKLWLTQGYVSPYTGQIIPLSKLFTNAYEIEHIFPKARYFDDSLNNKVVCESRVNKEKGKLTAYEFIKQRGGEVIDLGGGRSVSLFNLTQYEEHCIAFFGRNKNKLQKLMSEEIPED